jgi:hypothetical protein
LSLITRIIESVSLEGGKQSLTHRYEGSGGEIVTKLSVERFERNGKEGQALGIQRGDDAINVPVALGQFLYAGEFLRRLSVTEAWVEQYEDEREGNSTD